jgi:FG-GAP-like repeat
MLFAVSFLGSSAFAQSPQVFPNPQTGAAGASVYVPHAIGDFDGDGLTDLAIGAIGDAPWSTGVTLRRGQGLGFLRPAETMPLAIYHNGLAAADFDGDGKDDLAAASSATGTVNVLRDYDPPSFASIETLAFPPAGNEGALVDSGDFDGDGKLDIVVLPKSNSIPFQVFLGDGAGGFSGPLAGPLVEFQANSLCVGDFNEDGRSDVAWERRDNLLRLAFGQVGGSLGAPVTYDVVLDLLRVRLGDADEDGHDDVICSLSYYTSPDPGVVVAYGDGSGNLVLGNRMIAPLTFWSAIDLDGDGRTDLAGDNGAYFLGLGGGSFAPLAQLAGPKFLPGDPRHDLNQDGYADYLGYFPGNTVTLTLSTGALQYPAVVATDATAGSKSAGIAGGDFNEDGKQDLVVSDSSSTGGTGRFYLLTGNGQGGFTPAIISSIGTLQQTFTLASGDFDADGNLDFAAASWNTFTVLVVRGNGAGGFSVLTQFGLQGPPNELIAEDLNGDGILDLAAACSSGKELGVVYGLGGGAFKPPQSIDLAGGSYGLCSLDANGDPYRDLAATLNPNNAVSILLGSASGAFSLGQVIPAQNSPLRVAAGDLNQDGIDDLFVAANRSSLLLGNGNGGFTFAVELHEVYAPRWIDAAILDFDGDGFTDVLGLGKNGSAILARGNGQGQLEPMRWFAGSNSLEENSTFVLADFTSDGRKDFARPSANFKPFVVVMPGLEGGDFLPLTYCVPKASSNGCVPQIAWEGMPSASATSGFVIRASPALNQKPGLIIYSLFGPASQTLGGGTLCVSSPLRRSAAANTGGNALPAVDCSGVFSLDFASFAHGLLGGTPAPELLVPGTSVVGQWFGRDPGFAPPNNLMLSNALLWTVFP